MTNMTTVAQETVARKTADQDKSVTHEMATLKTGLRAMWMSGDYDRFSRYMEGTAREFYERLDVAPGSRLLDVACGAGQLALIAARDGADVTGVDIAANLVARAAARARGEGLRARFMEGDAEDLPFEDGSFDVVASVVGAMFAPRPERVAAELLRVCAPGGTIAMINWTAEGFIGRMFKTISSYIAPPGMPSPLLWGNEARVTERLGAGSAELSLTRRMYLFDYPFPPEEVVEFFARYYGPTYRAFATLDEAARGRLRQDLVALWSGANEAGEGATVVKAEYLEVVAQRR
jgi:ubiquinone/menaquinone biosynthesis C-methylase UbiE